MKSRISALLIFCSSWALSPALSAQELISIGLLAELSGANAANGRSCRQGYELARTFLAPNDRAGGKRIRFLFGDHKGEAKTGISEFKHMTSIEGAAAIITTRAQVALALNPLARNSKTPIWGILGHSRFTEDNPYAFQFWPTTAVEGAMLAQKASAMGKENVAVISAEDEWPLSLAEHFEKRLKELGGKIVLSVAAGLQESDFSSLLTKMQAVKPDAIFVNMTIAQAGLVMRKLREQGLRQQIFSNLYGSFDDTIAAAGKEAIEGLIFVAPNMNRPKFAAQFNRIFPEASPDATAYTCYSGLAAIIAAISSNNHNADGGNSLYDAALALKQVRLFDENLPIVRRQAQFDLIYKTIKNGRVEDL